MHAGSRTFRRGQGLRRNRGRYCIAYSCLSPSFCAAGVLHAGDGIPAQLIKNRQDIARANKKRRWTESAAKGICKKLVQLTDEAGVKDRTGYMCVCLDNSVAAGWLSVFPDEHFTDRSPVVRDPVASRDRLHRSLAGFPAVPCFRVPVLGQTPEKYQEGCATQQPQAAYYLYLLLYLLSYSFY